MCNEKYVLIGVNTKQRLEDGQLSNYLKGNYTSGQLVQILDTETNETLTEPITIAYALQLIKKGKVHKADNDLPTIVAYLSENGTLNIRKDYLDRTGRTVTSEAKDSLNESDKKYTLLLEPMIESESELTYIATTMMVARNNKLVNMDRSGVEPRTLQGILENGKIFEALEEDLTHDKLRVVVGL